MSENKDRFADLLLEHGLDEDDYKAIEKARKKKDRESVLYYVALIKNYMNRIMPDMIIGHEGGPLDMEGYQRKLDEFNELSSSKKNERIVELIDVYRSSNDSELKKKIAESIFYVMLQDIRAIVDQSVYILREDCVDIINELYLSLLTAIDNFDEKQNVSFRTYASKIMKNRIISYKDEMAYAGRSYSQTYRLIAAAENRLKDMRGLGQIDAAMISAYTGIDEEIVKIYLDHQEAILMKEDYESIVAWREFLEKHLADTVADELIADCTGLTLNRIAEVRGAMKAPASLNYLIGEDKDDMIELSEIIPDANMATPEQELHKQQIREVISNAFSLLDENEEDRIYKYLSNRLLVDYNRHVFYYLDNVYHKKDRLEERKDYQELLNDGLFKKNSDGKVLIYEEDLFEGIDIPEKEWDAFSDKVKGVLLDEGKSQYLIHETEGGYTFYLVGKGKKHHFICDKDEILYCFDKYDDLETCKKAIEDFRKTVKDAKIVTDENETYPCFRFRAVDKKTLQEANKDTATMDRAILCELCEDKDRVLASFMIARKKDRSYLDAKPRSDKDLRDDLIKRCQEIKDCSKIAAVFSEEEADHADEFKDLYNRMAGRKGRALIRSKIKDSKAARRGNIEVLTQR